MGEEEIMIRFRKNIIKSRLGFLITMMPLLIYIIVKDLGDRVSFITPKVNALFMAMAMVVSFIGFVMMVAFYRCPLCGAQITSGIWQKSLCCSSCGAKLQQKE